MKNFMYLLAAVVLVLSCQSGANQTDTAQADSDTVASSIQIRDGVFIHITESYNDPHRVLMPLKMANLMASDKDVLVYLDIHAVELVKKDAKDIRFVDFESAQTYIKSLLDKKIGIYACPTCLKVAGIKETDLMAGIQVAQKDKFFDFTSGRIINFDY